MQNTNNSFPELDGGFLGHISIIIRTAVPYFPKEAQSSLMFLSSILDFMSSFKLYSQWHVPVTSLPGMFNSVDYEALLNALRPCLSKNEADMVDAYFNFQQMSKTWKTAMEISSVLENFNGDNPLQNIINNSTSASSTSDNTTNSTSSNDSQPDGNTPNTNYSADTLSSFLSKEQLETYEMLKELLTQ